MEVLAGLLCREKWGVSVPYRFIGNVSNGGGGGGLGEGVGDANLHA